MESNSDQPANPEAKDVDTFKQSESLDTTQMLFKFKEASEEIKAP
jgi:hypothetical protein